MTEMTSWKRVETALEHREPDRIPFDLGGSVVTGIHRLTYASLRKYLGLPLQEIAIYDIVQQLASIHKDLQEKLKVDVYLLKPGKPEGWEPQIDTVGNYSRYIDEWGIHRCMPLEDGLYYDVRQHPLAEINDIESLENKYTFPDPVNPGRFVGMADQAMKYCREQKAYILGSNTAGMFAMALRLRGFENFYVDMVVNQKYAEYLLDKIMEVKWRYWEKALEEVGENVLIIYEADDLCGQNGCLISPQLYRKLIKSRHTQLFNLIKQKAKGKVYIFYHCCGAVKELIPDLIESGIDILNPVQVSAQGMDTKELKRLFGKDITFWGGGVDTQDILPHGTPQQVREEVKRRIDDLAPGGGFVFATVHNIQPDVPPENIMAMWETLWEYSKYK